MLRALGGKPAPLGLASDLERLGSFPPEALRDFWNALGPSLDEPITQEAEQALDAYCTRHALSDSDLAMVISSARFLVREAARRELSLADLKADLSDLVGYRVGLAHLSRGQAARSVTTHGRVIKQIDWRLERVIASNEASALDVLIARLTLATDGPDGATSTSLQLDMPTVLKLRATCDEILARADLATNRK
jgi:hypothetical protein